MVPVRLGADEVRTLDLLRRRGLYRSRNEAIRAILALGLEAKLSEDEDVARLVNRLLALSKNGKMPVFFKSKKSVVEIVAEGR